MTRLEMNGPEMTQPETGIDGDPLCTSQQIATLSTGVRFAGRSGENLEAAAVSPWRSKDKEPELERLAEMAGEASADAAVAMENAEHRDQRQETPRKSDQGKPVDLTAAAFFDVDNTMMMGASIFHFARGLAARKYFTTSDLAGFAWQQIKFRIGGREDKQNIQSSREQLLSFAAGRTVREMVEISEEIYDELMVDKIWPGTRALAQMHLDAGQRVWLVTATPVELAAIISRRLGLTGALGTVGESIDGVYTGRLVGDLLHGRAKAHAIRALAAREGLNLKRCTAYSDSQNDVPMLSAVGKAVAVNPDASLRETAKARGWEIRDFRTGRKAAKIGVPSVLGIGAIAGAIAAVAYRRR
jgi:HAD superfamily hydrolase (TIGR01490 family)